MNQEEINEEYPKIIKDIEDELIRAKNFCNENGYQIHTSIYPIVRRYRDELKTLKATLGMNIDG